MLLFAVGLKLDLHLIRQLGPVALATGLGQLFFTIVSGFLIALALGMHQVRALYVAVALTFSTTIIIVKLLSDKREIDSLPYRETINSRLASLRDFLLAGLTVAQISEFSIIFVAMGLSLGHVDQPALGLVTLVGLVTITRST